MVAVTRCGRRLAISAGFADKAAVTGTWPAWEDGVISSIRVGLVTGQAVSAALVHQNATAHQRSREAARCSFAAVGQGDKDSGAGIPSLPPTPLPYPDLWEPA